MAEQDKSREFTITPANGAGLIAPAQGSTYNDVDTTKYVSLEKHEKDIGQQKTDLARAYKDLEGIRNLLVAISIALFLFVLGIWLNDKRNEILVEKFNQQYEKYSDFSFQLQKNLTEIQAKISILDATKSDKRFR